jgi:hypothetical protein
MKNLSMKCIETFLIYIFFIFNILNDVIVISFILESPFHIILKNILHEFINHMFRDIHNLVYQYL